MRWRELVGTVLMLGGALTGGCQLLVTFESVPEGSGGDGTGGTSTGATGGAPTGGAPTGGAPTGGTGATGTTSEGGTMCMAACCATSDCPVPPDPCLLVTCSAGECVMTPVPENGDAAAQTPGDCKKLVCQGGLVVVVGDATDLLDDGNGCTVDTCSGNTPKSSNLGQNTQCALSGGASGICNGKGACVECTSNAHCPLTAPKCMGTDDQRKCVPLTCDNNVKDGAETDNDCGGPDCEPCNNGKPCVQGSDCENGVCNGNGVCGAPTCSDGAKNGNEADVDCGDGCSQKCLPGQRCDSGNQCQGNQCTGEGGVCVANCNDNLKNNTESDVDCGGGVCAGCSAGKACGGFDGNCLSGACGPMGTCEPGELATPCSADTDCLSTHCRDGVCCDSGCTGTCKSCKVAGSVGLCSNIPSGQDPQNECLNACNGNGACGP